MELIGQSVLIMLLVSSIILSGMTGYRLRNIHDGLLAAGLFVMLVSFSASYLGLWMVPISFHRAWTPLVIAILMFVAVFLRNAESDVLCRRIKENDSHG